jgi:signal transduction histidine kinase
MFPDSLRNLADRVCSAMNVEAAALFLRGHDSKTMTLQAASGCIVSPQDKRAIEIDEEALSSVAREHQVLERTAWLARSNLCGLLSFQPAAWTAALVQVDGDALGVMAAFRQEGRAFTELERGVLQLLAEQAASIIQHARLFEQVRAGRERAQTLSQQLMDAQEAERRRLAHELHDEIGQALTAVKMNLMAVARSLTGKADCSRMDDSIAVVDQALKQVRDLSLDLRPPALDDLGLVAALRWYLDVLARRAGLSAEFSASSSDLRMPAQMESACFRVAQEALTNVARHARARNVRVQLRNTSTELQLMISDDGSGFDVTEARRRAGRGGSLGLLGMQERVYALGGHIDIHSEPAHGTVVKIVLPLADAYSLERRSKRRASR